MALVLTKAALALKKAEGNVEVVKFEAYKPKKKKTAVEPENTLNTQNNATQKKDVDLKKIRHEVVKFGMSGFEANKKEEAKIALAVSLGAKPPRREYLNYKELMQKRKEQKQKEKEEKEQMVTKSRLHSVGKPKGKKKSNDVGHLLSSYGKVQKKDLKKKEDVGPKKKKKKII